MTGFVLVGWGGKSIFLGGNSVLRFVVCWSPVFDNIAAAALEPTVRAAKAINFLLFKIPISEDGEEVTLGEFLNTYNEQCTEALSYDKSFGEKVRPAMIRVFMKNGWGMSDGQYLAFMFGKDIVTKTSIVYSLKKSLNMTMTMIEKQYKIYKKENNITDKSTIKIDDDDDDLELYESEDIENDYYEPVVQPKPKPKAKPKAKAKPKSKTSRKFKIDYPNQPKDTLSQHPKEIQNEIIKGK